MTLLTAGPSLRFTMDGTTRHEYEESASFLRDKVPENLRKPQVAIICGSGLGGLAGTVHNESKIELDYTSIPHFSPSTGMKAVFLDPQLWV